MSEFDTKAQTWDQDPMKVERAMTVAQAITEQVPVAGLRVLEYGCGTGLLGFALREQAGTLTLADTSEGMLAVLRGKIEALGARNMVPLKLDLLADPLPGGAYDLVCSLMTLHHVPDTQGLLHAFREVLAPGGWVALADLDAEDGSFHGLAVSDVHLGFDRDQLGRQLAEAGFREVRFATVYEIRRGEGAELLRFPLFLVVARKA